MEVPAFPARVSQPFGDLRCLVRGQIVEDDVDGQLARHPRIDALEELLDGGRSVALAAMGDDLAAGDVEGGEEIGRSVALVVVGRGARATGAQR